MRFSHEYPKLSWKVFTTIRQDKGYYKEGKILNIDTPNQNFKAEVVSVRYIKKYDITETISKHDANMSRVNLLNMLEGWYGQYTDNYILLTLMRKE